jgi:hypothetical protein
MFGRANEPPHLEFEGAPLAVGEEVAAVVAEELEKAALLTSTLEDEDRTESRALARELRLWVFLASVCDRSDRCERESLIDRLEHLAGRAYVLLDAPRIVDEDTPPIDGPALVGRIVDIHELATGGFEDEMTEVRKAKWERSANRALGDGPRSSSAPGASSRPPPGNVTRRRASPSELG